MCLSLNKFKILFLFSHTINKYFNVYTSDSEVVSESSNDFIFRFDALAAGFFCRDLLERGFDYSNKIHDFNNTNWS